MLLDKKAPSRRSFLRRTMPGIAAFGWLGGARRVAEAQLVWKASEWKLPEFLKLVNEPARVKQVFDVVQIADGEALNSIKNALNGLQFGFGIPEGQIKVAAALHGNANLLNYDDYVWDKYRIGEWLNVTDPASGKHAVKNLFYKSNSKLKKGSKNPDDPNSIYQDTSMQALQARGVQFLSCHTALEEQVRVLIQRNQLAQSPEEIVRDMLAHTEPGVLVVAAMAAAIAVMQAEGHYTYIAA
jgi:intracellular sulfur oxidation DsrE/DsrF family protein